MKRSFHANTTDILVLALLSRIAHAENPRNDALHFLPKHTLITT